jgi:H+-transporting ATPase
MVIVIKETNFFENKFGAHLPNYYDKKTGALKYGPKDSNNPTLHTVVYLQVAIISQALIFVTRSHGFFFMERPSNALIFAFCLAQLISSIIAAYGDWGFTNIVGVEGAWIGIVWVWVSRPTSLLNVRHY